MQFTSTRCAQSTPPTYTFTQAILQGMPVDGGLFVPASPGLPVLNFDTLKEWRRLSYVDLAYEIIALFSAKEIPADALRSILESASSEFRLPEWTRLSPLEEDMALLELFHGPTYSFKDYAMCIIGRIMEYLLEKVNGSGTVLVATSGDTGSAAIGGFRKCSRVQCVILFPEGRVSDVQRRQMTTVAAKNIHCVSVRGDFDDCQRLLKEAFADPALKKEHRLLAVNSVNFGRIVCQIIYYFWSAFRAQEMWKNEAPISYCVPTGNFGNILAAFYAKQMGCPINRLIIASNVNDILPRFCQSGTYELLQVIPTMSPSIDIQVSSNFERLVRFHAAASVAPLFQSLSTSGRFEIAQEALDRILRDFCAYRCSETETLAACERIYNDYGRLIDTHTAVAVHAYGKYRADGHTEPVIVVSTAHPSKFGGALKRVIDAKVVDDAMPEALAEIANMPEIFVTIEAELGRLEDHLKAL